MIEEFSLSKKERNKRIMLIMLIATIFNLVLFGAKLYVGLAASSVSVISDSYNSLADSLVTAVAVLCFFLIMKNVKSKRLSHGFGRLEYVVSLLIAVAMVIIGITFLFRSLDRFALSSPINFKWLYFGVTVGAIVSKIALAIYYKCFYNKYKSDVLKCAFYDSLLDIGVSTMSLIGLVSMRYISLRLDAVFGIIVSIIMLVGGVILCKNGFIKILGASLDDKTKEEIENYISEIEGVKEIKFISFDDYGENEKYITIEIIIKKGYDLKVENIFEYILHAHNLYSRLNLLKCEEE